MADSPLKNRLQKNHRHFSKWAARRDLTAFRVYDRDMPEHPYAMDWYDGLLHVLEYPRRRAVREGALGELRQEMLSAASDALGISPEDIFVKTHVPESWGQRPPQAPSRSNVWREVREQGLTFKVNLSDYLDTGLFLDHRLTRARIREEVRGKTFLNLFAYTGSFTVYAAAGGARETTTVDLSNTYLEWAEENLRLNRLDKREHRLVRSDVLRWIREPRTERYDLIMLDPPSFSASKKMAASFDVQRDQVRLLTDVAGLLADNGSLYFSTNHQGFHLQEDRLAHLSFEELTPRSIPEDFRVKSIHRCWRIQQRQR